MTDTILVSLIERIERLLSEIAGLRGDVRDVYAEGEALGYDRKMMATMIRRRAMEPDAREMSDALVTVYEAALGMGDGEGSDAHNEALLVLAEAKAAKATEARLAQLAGLVAMMDPEAEQQLVALIAHVLDLRAQRREVTAEISATLKAVKPQGIDGARVTEVCRRVERMDKYGRDTVLAAEATRDAYADAYERAEAGDAIAKATSDPALQAFLSPAAPAKSNKITKSISRFRAQAAAARRSLER